jgi:hypothetical protein
LLIITFLILLYGQADFDSLFKFIRVQRPLPEPTSAIISPHQPASADAERPPLANRLHDLARHLTLVINTNAPKTRISGGILIRCSPRSFSYTGDRI